MTTICRRPTRMHNVTSPSPIMTTWWSGIPRADLPSASLLVGTYLHLRYRGPGKSIHNKILKIIGICQRYEECMSIYGPYNCLNRCIKEIRELKLMLGKTFYAILISDEFRRDMIYYISYIARNIMLLYLQSIAWGINGVHSSRGTNRTYTLSPLIWMENVILSYFSSSSALCYHPDHRVLSSILIYTMAGTI